MYQSAEARLDQLINAHLPEIETAIRKLRRDDVGAEVADAEQAKGGKTDEQYAEEATQKRAAREKVRQEAREKERALVEERRRLEKARRKEEERKLEAEQERRKEEREARKKAEREREEELDRERDRDGRRADDHAGDARRRRAAAQGGNAPDGRDARRPRPA